jgi:hypothetical protein
MLSWPISELISIAVVAIDDSCQKGEDFDVPASALIPKIKICFPLYDEFITIYVRLM